MKLEPHLREAPDRALHIAEEGAVEPLAGAHALLNAAQVSGAQFAPHQHVKSIILKGGKAVGVVTEDRELIADEVVLAAGAGSVQLAQTAGVTIPLTTPPGLIVHPARAPALINGLIFAPELHVRQTAEGRIVAGSDFGGSVPGEHPDKTARDLFSKVQSFIDGAESLSIDHHTVGYRPTPRDGLPIIGRPTAVDGLYLAVMHSGITNAAATGLFAAQEILTGDRDALLAPFDPNRFSEEAVSKVSFQA